MSDLRELYQEVILDHHRRPRNFRKLPGANKTAEGYNPLCGDRLTLALNLEGGIVREIGFEGTGCAVATASASMMTETIKGKTEAEGEALFQRFHDLITGMPADPNATPQLGKLEA